MLRFAARQVVRRQRAAARRQERFEAISAWADALKHQRGCCSCPETDPSCLDWYRPDQAAKAKSIAQLIRELKPVEDLKKEALKCLVYCANCHLKSLREGGTAAPSHREPKPKGPLALLHLRERQRRAMIASLVSLDAEIAELHGALHQG